MLHNIEWESEAVDVCTFIKSIFFATVSLLPALGGNNRTVKQWARPGQARKVPCYNSAMRYTNEAELKQREFPPQPLPLESKVPAVDDPCPRCNGVKTAIQTLGHTVMDEHDMQRINIKRPEWVEE